MWASVWAIIPVARSVRGSPGSCAGPQGQHPNTTSTSDDHLSSMALHPRLVSRLWSHSAVGFKSQAYLDFLAPPLVQAPAPAPLCGPPLSTWLSTPLRTHHPNPGPSTSSLPYLSPRTPKFYLFARTINRTGPSPFFIPPPAFQLL